VTNEIHFTILEEKSRQEKKEEYSYYSLTLFSVKQDVLGFAVCV
jgi:hypothetical protein